MLALSEDVKEVLANITIEDNMSLGELLIAYIKLYNAVLLKPPMGQSSIKIHNDSLDHMVDMMNQFRDQYYINTDEETPEF